MSKNSEIVKWRTGSLPNPAPLALAYVPMQESAVPAYEANAALAKGTLFPGLDLPFMNVVNSDLPETPLTEMMVIDFVADELELYLDTHAEDQEAFDLYQAFLALKKEARERFVKQCGPVSQSDMLGMREYAWLKEPWPWEFESRRGE